MYDKKSDYALNKLDPDAIVYNGVADTYRLTREDFSNEEEFLRWKTISDLNYEDTEKSQRSDNECLSLSEDYDAPSPSVEELTLIRLRNQEEAKGRASAIRRIRSILTERQYRRLWLYCVKGMTEEQIGIVEGISHQNVSKSILAARKKVLKKFSKQGAKMTF